MQFPTLYPTNFTALDEMLAYLRYGANPKVIRINQDVPTYFYAVQRSRLPIVTMLLDRGLSDTNRGEVNHYNYIRKHRNWRFFAHPRTQRVIVFIGRGWDSSSPQNSSQHLPEVVSVGLLLDLAKNSGRKQVNHRYVLRISSFGQMLPLLSSFGSVLQNRVSLIRTLLTEMKNPFIASSKLSYPG